MAKPLYLSASQFKTFELCPRKWWFEKVRRLPGSSSSYGHTFGLVLHALIERWLGADASGRDPETGEPVDFYPEGWQTTEDGETLRPEDEVKIKDLLSKAIVEGVLVRRPGAVIEKSFTVPMIEGVMVTGRIDLSLPGEIQDHKSVKAMRWALSPEKLKEDTQMLLYAYVEEAGVLRHNVFEREGDNKVRKTVAMVSEEEKQAKWDDLKAKAAIMKALKDEGPKRDYKEVAGSYPDACNAYGGCRFLSLCLAKPRETLDEFEERNKRLAA